MKPYPIGIEQSMNTLPIKSNQKPAKAQQNFADTLKNTINHVNQSQISSDKVTEALANGEVNNLHNVMITAQKASITLETAVQVQRKVIDAYNEVMRMQL